ncbi:MAG: hypothetical protein ABI700_26800 [Chloroflexota bacterium]
MSELDETGWRSLETLENGEVRLDLQSVREKLKIPEFIKLYEQGYSTLQETGPGDSIHVFKITPSGIAALAARRDHKG